MNRYLAIAAILLASTAAASAQTIIPCLDTDPSADTSGACSAAPTTTLPNQGPMGTLNQGAPGIDQNPTSAIPEPPTPQGMAPLVVPNDPLGHGIDQNPVGSSNTGTPSGINGNGAISSPAIR
jgi:hypothetical protein